METRPEELAEFFVQLVLVGIYGALLISIIHTVYLKLRLNRLVTLFRFCDLRREIMRLTREGRLSVRSLTFQFTYKVTSDIIHYSNYFKFSSKEFLSAIRRDEISLEEKTFFRKIHKDAKGQGHEVALLIHLLGDAVYLGFKENSLLLKMASSRFAVPFRKLYLRLRPAFLKARSFERSYELMTSARRWRDAVAVNH